MKFIVSSARGCALKTLFIPVIIVALGILAALPFRRSEQGLSAEAHVPTTDSNEHAVQRPSTRPTGASSAGFPSSVSPLLVDSEGVGSRAGELLSELQPLTAKPESIPRPEVGFLPRSYEEIAVPLVDRDNAKNLLSRSGAELSRSSGSVNGWAYDRFGIPRPANESPALASLPQSATSEASAPIVWTDPLPIVERVPQEWMMASDRQRTDERIEESSTTPAQEVGLFQPVKSQAAKSQAAKNNGLSMEASQLTANESEPRKRHWIYEPLKK